MDNKQPLNENAKMNQNWHEENKKFIEEYNKLLKVEGVPLKEYRKF